MVKLKIKECNIAGKCTKCIKICPVGALMIVPSGKLESKKTKPKYTIRPYFEDLCTKCGLCVNICPKKAIELL